MKCSIKGCDRTENLHTVEFEGLTLRLCPYHTMMSMARGMDYIVAEMNEQQNDVDSAIDAEDVDSAIDAEIEYERRFTNAMLGIRDGDDHLYEDHPDQLEREYL